MRCEDAVHTEDKDEDGSKSGHERVSAPRRTSGTRKEGATGRAKGERSAEPKQRTGRVIRRIRNQAAVRWLLGERESHDSGEESRHGKSSNVLGANRWHTDTT
jgi:hypothetical protein